MMVESFDAIVVGVGGMGSAALLHLAQRDARVLGLERFDIPHELGSSHGLTRIIRLAYWEDPAYVPLVRRAYELWRELERVTGEELLVITGSIDAGPAQSRPIRGALEACKRFELPYELFGGRALHQRFPGYQLPANIVAVFQPDGGYLLSERCITAHVNAAMEHGAAVHTNERVVRWESRGDRVLVHTERATYATRRLVISAGPWAGKIVQAVNPLLAVERQVVLWLTPKRPEYFQPERFPVFYFHADEGSFYGFPIFSDLGVKIGRYHHLQQIVDPDRVDRGCHVEDETVLRDAVARYFPDANGPTNLMKTCLFTNTRDEHFIIDTLSDAPRIVVAAGFSGHGFKFCSVVGEILADLALEGHTEHDISLFALERFR